MYKITKQGDTNQYNLVEYVCDLLTDVQDLPTTVAPGSTAIIIENTSVWMLSPEKIWKELR